MNNLTEIRILVTNEVTEHIHNRMSQRAAIIGSKQEFAKVGGEILDYLIQKDRRNAEIPNKRREIK